MTEHRTQPLKSGALIVGVGASRGLGAAIARRFARGGHSVTIAGRNAAKLQATADELKQAGASVSIAVGDATRAEDVRRFVAEADRIAPLRVAVHNAGGNEPAPFLKVSEESFTQHWREHALGAYLLAQAAIPVLLRHGGGSLLFCRRLGQLARQSQLCAVRIRKGRCAQPGAKHRARVRAARHPCRARDRGRRHRGGSPAITPPSSSGEARSRRLAAPRRNRRGPIGPYITSNAARGHWNSDLRPWGENFSEQYVCRPEFAGVPIETNSRRLPTGPRARRAFRSTPSLQRAIDESTR